MKISTAPQPLQYRHVDTPTSPPVRVDAVSVITLLSWQVPVFHGGVNGKYLTFDKCMRHLGQTRPSWAVDIHPTYLMPPQAQDSLMQEFVSLSDAALATDVAFCKQMRCLPKIGLTGPLPVVFV